MQSVNVTAKRPTAADRWKKALKKQSQSFDQPDIGQSWKLEQCSGMVVVGLGSLHAESLPETRRSEERQLQLALSLAIHGIMPTGCSLDYIDPLFNHDDVKTLQEIGGNAWSQVWSPRFLSSSPFIYMPCCSRSLTHTVIADVISSGVQAALIGNSLQAFVDSAFLCQESKEEWEATREIEALMSSRVKEVPLPDIGGAHGVALGLHYISLINDLLPPSTTDS